MTYLEAQNRDSTRPGLGVSFPNVVWPFLLSRATEVEAVLFGARGRVTRLDPCGVESLGKLAALAPRKQEEVRHLSFYGGNMNVLFRSASRSLIEALISPWPVVQIKHDEEPFPPSWTVAEKKAFSSLVTDMPEGCFTFCFGHDGDPLFVFSNPESLLADF